MNKQGIKRVSLTTCEGTADFFAIDAYTVDYSTAPPNGIAACVANTSDPNWPVCSISPQYDTNNWGIGPYADPGSPWLAATPGFVRYELQQLHSRWPTNKLVRLLFFNLPLD